MLFPLHKILCIAALTVVLSGCSESHEKETVSVTGAVTLDGKPLAEGGILFLPESGRASTGKIASDGTYRMSTYGDGDGVTVGKHQIYIKPLTNKSESLAEEEMDKKPKLKKTSIPIRYQSIKTSGLQFEVKAGEKNVYDIKLITNRS